MSQTESEKTPMPEDRPLPAKAIAVELQDSPLSASELAAIHGGLSPFRRIQDLMAATSNEAGRT